MVTASVSCCHHGDDLGALLCSLCSSSSFHYQFHKTEVGQKIPRILSWMQYRMTNRSSNTSQQMHANAYISLSRVRLNSMLKRSGLNNSGAIHRRAPRSVVDATVTSGPANAVRPKSERQARRSWLIKIFPCQKGINDGIVYVRKRCQWYPM